MSNRSELKSRNKRNRSFGPHHPYELPNPQNPYMHERPTPIQRIGPGSRASSRSLKSMDTLPPLSTNSQSSKLSTIDSSRSRSSSHSFIQLSEKYLRHESVLEAFLGNSMTMKLSSAIEQTISLTLKASTVTFWQDIPSLHALFSDRVKQTVDHSEGLVGFTFFSREITRIPEPTQHPAYSEKVDSALCPKGTPVLLFPLWDDNNNICAVVEVTREAKDPFFDDEDDEFIQFFIKKFKIYAHWLYVVKPPHEDILELLQLMEIEQFLILFQRKICSLFDCNSGEIWKQNITTKELAQYRRSKSTIDIAKAGIVGEALLKGCPINCAINKLQSSYNAEIDGNDSEPVIVVPLIDIKQNMRYAIVLRGKKGIPVFSQEQEDQLRSISPYIILALDNNIKYSDSGSRKSQNAGDHICVQSLNKTVEQLTEGSPIEDIITYILESAEYLTNSERTYLFVYDKDNDVLKTKVATNVKGKLKMSLDHGIVGQTYRYGKIYNIPDAYEDLDFDSSLDLETGYRTQSLISTPVLNNRKQIIAVAQFLNKKDGKPFSTTDLGYIKVLTSFCGLLMENEVMYHQSSTSFEQIRSYLNVSFALSSNQSIKQILNEIMQNARKVINADRASLFLLDEVVGALTSYLVDGGKMPQTIPLSHGIAATTAKTKEAIMVNDAYHDPRFNKMIDYNTGFKTHSVLAAAVCSSDGVVLGVVEMINKKDGKFSQDDLKMLQSFASFAGMSLETRKLKYITERGNVEVEMNKWIGDFEKKSFITPTKLEIPPGKQSQILSLDFFCIDYNGIGLFKVAFFVFNTFSLLEKFQINNALFFTFLYKLREEYNEPPYHNWIHAIDVLQYFSYQIKKANFDNILTGLELLSICVASICHDVGHEGFNNVYNVNAQTPLGILFKDQSVMETHHCSTTIHIIAQDPCNIFHALPNADLKKIWSWIIQMILATDMAHHFKLVKNANDIMDQGPINLSNESHRIMAMTMLMKVSDISNVSRPFEIAEKWCDVLCEEFWRQGDMEKAEGLEISSDLNDRNNNNKPKGQIGFYNFICLPLYQACARIFPELEVNVDAVRGNLEKWKSILAQQQAAQELATQKQSNNDAANTSRSMSTSRSTASTS